MWIYRHSPRIERYPGPDVDGKFEVGYLAGEVAESFVAVKVVENEGDAMKLVHYLNGGNG